MKSLRKGFTLIELLVVIAIIAVLASVIVASVKSAKEKAKSAETASHMKQVNTAILSLMTEGIDDDLTAIGVYPPYEGSFVDNDGNPAGDYNWHTLVAEEIGIAIHEDQGQVKWTGDPSESILQNPMSTIKFGNDKDPYAQMKESDHRGGFLYNAYIGDSYTPGDTVQNADDPDERLPRRATADTIPDPAATILITEGDDSRVKATLYTGTKRYSKGNYKDSCHCLFVDGHIELIKNEVLNSQRGQNYYFKRFEKGDPPSNTSKSKIIKTD